MPQQIKRLVIAFSVILILVFALRQVLKPESFGELGHFRAKAIPENLNKQLHYAVMDSCTQCHKEIRAEKDKGHHAKLKCEVCHGPGLKHVTYAGQFKNGELPDSLKLFKPADRKDCTICHQLNAARIKIQFDTINTSMIHMIDPLKHNPGDEAAKEVYKCIDCHNPHNPE